MDEQVRTTREHADNFINQIVNGLPEFLGAILILLVGYLVAKALAGLVNKGLNRANFDRRLHSAIGGSMISRAVPNPSNIASAIVFWVLFLFAISLAVAVLGIPVLVNLVEGIFSYIPNIIAAIIIFLAASAIAAGVATLVTNTMGDTPTGKVVATVGPVIVMGIAVFMILNQLGIAPAIVTITYTALVGSAALGMALAFGLGGRDVASRMLQDMYDKGQKNKGQIVSDLRKGTQEARGKANDKRNNR